MLSDFRAYIQADSTLASTVGTINGGIKMFPHVARADTTMPFITYSTINESSTDTHDQDSSASALYQDVLQLEIFTKTFSEGKTIKDRLRALLSSANFTQGATHFGYVEWQGSQDFFNDENETFRHSISLEILWRNS
mgnify:CR=1 FL=1